MIGQRDGLSRADVSNRHRPEIHTGRGERDLSHAGAGEGHGLGTVGRAMGDRQRGGSTAQRGRRKRNGDAATLSRAQRGRTEGTIPRPSKIGGSGAAADGDAHDGHRDGLRVLKSRGRRSAGDADGLIAKGYAGGSKFGLREGRRA